MKTKVGKQHRFFLIGIVVAWALFLISQAIFTPLHVDECYYWMFGQYLDWGYFDHPPGVALLIYLSDFLFNGNLSVRFFSIVSQLGSFYIIWSLVDTDNKKSKFLPYFMMFVLLPLNHIYGFITTPDVPLILTTSVFFLFYKKILETDKFIWYVLWGVAMSAMLYSKYHGALVIIFVLLSHPKLFLNYKTYIAGALGLLLFFPHMYWQYLHDFASFRYHLEERGLVYKSSYSVEYLLNVLLIFNPMFIGYVWKLVRTKPISIFERSLLVTFVGFILFFGWQSFRVHIQPQWIILCYIPFLVLTMNRYKASQWKFLNRAFWITFPLFISLHVFMVFDLLPNDLNIHGQKDYVERIKEDANGLPVVFQSSYKRASIFSWYSDQKYTHSVNWARSRKNQFNIWEHDSIFYDKDVFFVGGFLPAENAIKYEDGSFGKKVNYGPSDNIEIKVLNYQLLTDSLDAEVEFYNPYNIELVFPQEYHFSVFYYENKKASRDRYHFSDRELILAPFSKDTINIRWPIPENNKIDQFGLGAGKHGLPNGPLFFRHSIKFE